MCDRNIYAISDLHLSINNNKPMDIFNNVWHNHIDKIRNNWCNVVKDNDIVLIAGDISWAMRIDDFISDIKLISDLKGIKILIKGNHDYWWNKITQLRNIFYNQNIYFIQNDSIKIDNYIFCGTRLWENTKTNITQEQQQCNTKIYTRELIRLKMSLENARNQQKNNEKIIVLTHYSPINNNNDEIIDLLHTYNVDSVVYGHMHNYYNNISNPQIINNIKFYLTSCDFLKNKLLKLSI